MDAEDVKWIKVSSNNWSHPDRRLELPEAALFDAHFLNPVLPISGAATRETMKCEACLANKRERQKLNLKHDLVYGRCLNAVPPVPVDAEETVDIEELADLDGLCRESSTEETDYPGDRLAPSEDDKDELAQDLRVARAQLKQHLDKHPTHVRSEVVVPGTGSLMQASCLWVAPAAAPANADEKLTVEPSVCVCG